MELIHQDKPDLLRIILQHYTINKTASSSSTHDTNSPLHLAAILGREECMTVVVAQETNLSFEDFFVLSAATKTKKQQHQQLSKLLLSRNNNQETPLHIACAHARVDLVEIFLSSIGTTTCMTTLPSARRCLETFKTTDPPI